MVEDIKRALKEVLEQHKEGKTAQKTKRKASSRHKTAAETASVIQEIVKNGGIVIYNFNGQLIHSASPPDDPKKEAGNATPSSAWREGMYSAILTVTLKLKKEDKRLEFMQRQFGSEELPDLSDAQLDQLYQEVTTWNKEH